MQLTYKPIIKWPGELTEERERSRFDSPWGKTLRLLERELEQLHATNVVFQVAANENDIRLDGGLKAGRLLYHPGVIITFDSIHGPLSYYTDLYKQLGDNVRAIALALEALRRVTRYAVNSEGSQYEGYKRLNAAPAATNGRPKIETPEQAAEFMAKVLPGVTSEQLLNHGYLMDTLYRQAARILHPDNKVTGDDAKFVELQDAAAVLRTHHGL